MMSEAFFELHRDLPREGPGEPQDVLWALDLLFGPPGRILDAACGPGADTLTLAEHCPDAQIEARDLQPHFVEAARALTQPHEDRVICETGDMFEAQGPFDLIWCAGAMYFAGVTEGLKRFSGQLADGGHIAFSEPLKPGRDAPREAHVFWEEYPQIMTREEILMAISDAGYSMIGHRMIIDAPWAAYYEPMQQRIDMLRGRDDAELNKVLDEGQREIDFWRAASDHVAYMLFVVAKDG